MMRLQSYRVAEVRGEVKRKKEYHSDVAFLLESSGAPSEIMVVTKNILLVRRFLAHGCHQASSYPFQGKYSLRMVEVYRFGQ